MKHYILFIVILLFKTNIIAQDISSQEYNNIYIYEEFEKSSERFKLVTNNENYFTIDKGDYFLRRNNHKSEYLLIAHNSNISDFILNTKVKIGPSENNKAGIGIILKAEKENAIIFEINKQSEYRIKKKINTEYQNLSGDTKKRGWVKSNLIKGVNKYNLIEIRSENNIYDVYINNKYLTTFFVSEINNGSCGIIINAATQARISYYHIKTKEPQNKIEIINTNKSNTANTTQQKEEIEKLNRKISDLITDSNKLQEKNKKLNKQLNELEKKISNTEATNKSLRSQVVNITQHNNLSETKEITIKIKDNEIVNLKNQIIDLNNKNEVLNSYLETVNNKNQILQYKNDKLKELFILKDFEINGIKPSDTTKLERKRPQKNKIQEATVYSVQLGVYTQKQPYMDNVWYKTTEQGTFIYYSGEFRSLKLVTKHMNKLVLKGYKDAFVVTLNK